MKVLLAKTAGFCFGVKRAVDTVYQQVEENKDCKIYTFGPIIHNDEVIKDMQAKGVTVLEGEEDLPKAKNGIVIIRSHGVPKRICDRMDELGIQKMYSESFAGGSLGAAIMNRLLKAAGHHVIRV